MKPLLTMLAMLGVLGAQPAVRLGPLYQDAKPNVMVVIDTPWTGEGSEPDLESIRSSNLVEEGKVTSAPSAVQRFRQTGQGVALVIAIDTSGSMMGQPLESAKRALLRYAGEMRASDRVAVVSFGSSVRTVVPFTASAAEVRAGIQSLRAEPSGSTNLYSGVFRALELLERGESLPERRRLLVVSDGRDETSATGTRSYGPTDVTGKATSLGVPVDSIGLPSAASNVPARLKQLNRVEKLLGLAPTPAPPSVPAEVYAQTLQRISEATGGSFVLEKRPAQVGDRIYAGVQWVLNAPVATFAIQSLPFDAKAHSVAVRIGDRTTAARSFTVWQGRVEDLFRNPAVMVAGGVVLVLLAGGVFWLGRRPNAAPAPPVTARPAPDRPADHGTLPPVHPAVRPPTIPVPPRSSQPQPQPRPRAGTVFISSTFAHPSAGQPPVTLVVERGPLAGQSYPIERDQVTIGFLPENHICLRPDSFVSQYHAVLEYTEGIFQLTPYETTNGTYQNGRLLPPNVPAVLSAGDELQFGESVVRVVAS